jgi:SRSO17 transposase
MAMTMLQRAVDAQVPFRWVTGDSVYGDDRSIRLWLETIPRGYVFAVSGKEHVWQGSEQVRISTLLQTLPDDGWTRLSAGDGTKGPRLYDWQRMAVNDPPVAGWRRWVLVRRSISAPSEVTAYVCCAPADTPLETLVQVAGRRWTVEQCIEETKGEVGLDHYEVRSWTGWYRHTTLACLAHALLVVLRNQAPDVLQEGPKKGLQPQPTTSSLATFKARRGLWSP